MVICMALEEHSFIMEIFIKETFTKVECKEWVYISIMNHRNGPFVTLRTITLAKNSKRGSSVVIRRIHLISDIQRGNIVLKLRNLKLNRMKSILTHRYSSLNKERRKVLMVIPLTAKDPKDSPLIRKRCLILLLRKQSLKRMLITNLTTAKFSERLAIYLS